LQNWNCPNLLWDLMVARGGRNFAPRTLSQIDLRQSKIQNLGRAALGNKNVGWLDVAVNNAFPHTLSLISAACPYQKLRPP
jgi:hypothetical protein